MTPSASGQRDTRREGGREKGERKEEIFTQVVFSAWACVCDEIGDLIGVLLSNRTYRS